MNTGSPTAKALIALLARDPDAGLLPYIKLAARMGIAKRRVGYVIERLRNKRMISRDHQGRLVVGEAPPVQVSEAATKPRPVLAIGVKQDLKGGRQRRDRKFPPRSDGKVPQHAPTPATLTADAQRDLQRRLRKEQEIAEAVTAERVRVLQASSVHTKEQEPKRRRICFDCGNLAHRRRRIGKCSCGERYEPEQIEVVTFGQSSIATCGD